MAEGYFDFVAGAVLTAQQIEDVELQAVLRFASAAARDSALSGVLTEGLMAYLKDVNTLTIYTGSAWSTIGPVHGAGTSWTPALTATSVNPTLGSGSVQTGSYFRLGRLIVALGRIKFGASGTAAGSGTYEISMPVTGLGTSAMVFGGVRWTISSGSSGGTGVLIASSSTKMNVGVSGSANLLTTTTFAANDDIGFHMVYEAAADA